MILIEFHRFEMAIICELQRSLPHYMKENGFNDCLVTATDTNKEAVVYCGVYAKPAFIRITHDHVNPDITELIRILHAYPYHPLYGYGMLIDCVGRYVPPDRAGHLP